MIRRVFRFIALPRALWVGGVLTLIYVVALALNLTPWLRGPDEWRWAYALPATLARLWLPGLLLCGYVLLSAWLVKRAPTHGTLIAVLLSATFMTPALQLALLYMDHPDVRSQLFYRTVSESAGGYFNVGAQVNNPNDFLAHFVEQMPNFPIHPQKHPPGLPLLFAEGRQFFEHQPDLTENINAVLRPYQCQNLPLMNLPDAALASATLQMIVPFLLGLVIWPLFLLGREIYDEDTALRGALVWPLIPSIALFATRWDQVYALFMVITLLLVHLALTRRKLVLLFLSGVTVSLSLFFSLTNIFIVGVAGVYALIWWGVNRRQPGVKWMALGAVVFVVGGSLLWIVLRSVYNLDLLALWRTAVGMHLELERSYFTWLFFNLYDFFVFLGIPIAVWWFTRLVRSLRETQLRLQPADVLAIAFAIALIVLDLSGAVRGEIARVWALFMPLPLLTAVHGLPQKSKVFTGLIVLLGLQVFISNIFLRTVGTGLSDPPAPPISQQASASFNASWAPGMAAQVEHVPQSIERGQALDIDVNWAATMPIMRPYTIFVHLIAADGQLAAQYDNMPLQGAWPTTCWQVGQSFNETLPLAIPPDLPAGRYQLRLGFYWLPNLERAPIGNSDSLDLGVVEVQ